MVRAIMIFLMIGFVILLFKIPVGITLDLFGMPNGGDEELIVYGIWFFTTAILLAYLKAKNKEFADARQYKKELAFKRKMEAKNKK